MKAHEAFQAYADYVMPTYARVPLLFVKGKGSRLWDIHHKAYLDFFPGWGVGSLGHCHPKVMQAVRDQVSKLIFVANNYYHPAQARLAQELVRLSFPSKAFFCNSGAEANEAAIKLCRKFGNGRYEIITFENAFHGRTLAAITATGQKKYLAGFEPLPQGFVQARLNDMQSVRAAFGEKTVAVMLELIQGEGGINVAETGFVAELRRFCDEHNLLLVIDEVQTGIGRTGRMFCYQHYGITPDIMTLAKALAGGLPIGVMLAKKEIADTLSVGTHASTFGGGPVVCRAALAVLKAVREEKLLANVRRAGEYLFSRLEELKEKHSVIIKEVRGMGLMAGVELYRGGKAVVESCLAQGLLINCTHENVLRLMPALNVTRKDINRAIILLDEALKGARQ